MRNFIQPGEVLTLTAPKKLSSGAGVLVGSIFGIAGFDAASGDDVEVSRRGVFSLTKPSATAISQGDPLYWDDDNAQVAVAAGDDSLPLIGAAAEDGASDATSLAVLLDGVIRV